MPKETKEDKTAVGQDETNLDTPKDSTPQVKPLGVSKNQVPVQLQNIDEIAQEDVNLEEFFSEIYSKKVNKESKLNQGLKNLLTLPDFDSEIPPVAGKVFSKGVLGFRRFRNNLMIAVACGKAQVRYIDLQKYIAMIENMHDEKSASIMLQNFQDQEDNKTSKGQILGRLNPVSSAIHIIQGLTGRILRNPSDIALFDVYYLNREDLTSYYLAAKAQIKNDDLLETMIATYDGWKAFNVPLNPLDPYGD